ncbi:MAG: hypothetical protein U9Q90_04170 [Campylobacterota bacterium]|nr:hypothetical protein [Campylobacterota bacterium]
MASLGQVSKRLQIIKIAISITDDETINLQRSKLRLYKNDKQLENILAVLDDENYAQASNLINRYIHGPYKEESAEAKDSATLQRDQEEEELIRKFGLFVDEEKENGYNPIRQEEIISMAGSQEQIPAFEKTTQQAAAPQQPIPTTEEIMSQYSAIEEDVIPQKHIHIPTSVKESQPEEPAADFDTDEKPFEAEEELKENTVLSDTETNTYQEDEATTHFDFDNEIVREEEQIISPSVDKEKLDEEIDQIEEEENQESQPISNDMEQNEQAEEPIEYEPISYIDQKLRNMLNQYPQVEETSKRFDNEERLLYMISLEGYSEADIEKTIENVKTLKEEGQLGEAAHLLLIAAATESLFAQFILARELYTGGILQRDLPEAFTQINRLAMDDYPEAVCDLAQLYEHGIGITKDKKKAFQLYEDAFDLGVKRAEGHLIRMEEESKGILEKLFRR